MAWLPGAGDVVLEAIVERIDTQRRGDLVHQDLQRKVSQRRAQTSERTTGGAIRIDGHALETSVWTGIEIQCALADAAGDIHSRCHKGAGVHSRVQSIAVGAPSA